MHMQAAAELARDKETLLAVVSGCKDAAGAHLDFVQAALYQGLQQAVAAQVCSVPVHSLHRLCTGFVASLPCPRLPCSTWLVLWALAGVLDGCTAAAMCIACASVHVSWLQRDRG